MEEPKDPTVDMPSQKPIHIREDNTPTPSYRPPAPPPKTDK